MLQILDAQLNQASLCEPILRLLPHWFGIESAIAHYVEKIDGLPTFLAWDQQEVVGFLSIKQHHEFAAEIFVMAIHPQFHRQGIGKRLVEVAEKALQQQGIEYLQVKTLGLSQVKTLGLSRPDPNYAKTRAFYESVGFKPLEEFLELWEGNPCLQMVKALQS